jgi:hypothetical protein
VDGECNAFLSSYVLLKRKLCGDRVRQFGRLSCRSAKIILQAFTHPLVVAKLSHWAIDIHKCYNWNELLSVFSENDCVGSMLPLCKIITRHQDRQVTELFRPV